MTVDTVQAPPLGDPFANLRYYRQAMKQLAGELANLDLTVTDCEALLLIRQSSEAVRPSDLAAEIGITKSGSTRLIRRLIRRGLVSKSLSVIDHREINLRLTANGLSVLSMAMNRPPADPGAAA